MPAALHYADHDDSPREDHVVFLSDVSWNDYERLFAIRGDHSVPRISYLTSYVLRNDRYLPMQGSEVLPGLDLALLNRFIGEPTTSAAIRGFRAALHERDQGAAPLLSPIQP